MKATDLNCRSLKARVYAPYCILTIILTMCLWPFATAGASKMGSQRVMIEDIDHRLDILKAGSLEIRKIHIEGFKNNPEAQLPIPEPSFPEDRDLRIKFPSRVYAKKCEKSFQSAVIADEHGGAGKCVSLPTTDEQIKLKTPEISQRKAVP